MNREPELIEALQGIKRNQEKQLAGMKQSLDMQRRQFEMARVQ